MHQDPVHIPLLTVAAHLDGRMRERCNSCVTSAPLQWRRSWTGLFPMKFPRPQHKEIVGASWPQLEEDILEVVKLHVPRVMDR